MYGLLRVLIHRAYHVAVDGIRHEGNERSSAEDRVIQGGIQGHIRIDLILLHPLCPETLTAPADIPVGKIVGKLLQRAAGFRNAVSSHVFIYGADHGVHLGKDPFVHDCKAAVVKCVLCRIKAVDIGIEDVERVRIPEGAEEFALSFRNCLSIETVRKPGS